jgi:hypothetical protein
MKEQRTHNSRLPQWGLTWLNQVQCFYQYLCLVDSEVLLNPHCGKRQNVTGNFMKTIISTISLLLFTSFAFGQCDNAKVLKQDISDFINSFDKIDTTGTFYLSSSNQFDKIEEDIQVIFNDTTFSSFDKYFFKQQMRQHRNFRWNNKVAKGDKLFLTERYQEYLRIKISIGSISKKIMAHLFIVFRFRYSLVTCRL